MTCAEGPLFAGHRREEAPEHLQAVAETLREALAGGPVRIDWHLAERRLHPGGRSPSGPPSAGRRARHGLAFALRPPSRPVALADGLDRHHPALLTAVGLRAARTAPPDPGRQRRGVRGRAGEPGPPGDSVRPAQRARVPSALHAAAGRGSGGASCSDRARLAVVPLGLEGSGSTPVTGEGVGAGRRRAA